MYDLNYAISKTGIISSFDSEAREFDREANVSWTSLTR